MYFTALFGIIPGIPGILYLLTVTVLPLVMGMYVLYSSLILELYIDTAVQKQSLQGKGEEMKLKVKN